MICRTFFLAMISAVGKLHRGIYNACQAFGPFDMTVVPILAYAILGLTKKKMHARSVERHGTNVTVLSHKVTSHTFLSSPDSAQWWLINGSRRRCVIDLSMKINVRKA
jgi:hypothetical protein